MKKDILPHSFQLMLQPYSWSTEVNGRRPHLALQEMLRGFYRVQHAPEKAAKKFLHELHTIALPLGYIYAFAFRVNPDAIHNFMEVKGRDKSKFNFMATDLTNVETQVRETRGISQKVPDDVKRISIELFKKAAENGGPGVGIIWEANDEDFPYPPVFQGELQIEERRKVKTFGIMVSNDPHFSAFLEQLPENEKLVGISSANIGDDTKHTFGSSIHDPVLLYFLFKGKKNITFYFEKNFHRKETRTRSGKSLSTVFLESTSNGTTAFIARDGSTPHDRLEEMLKSVGISNIREIHGGARKVSPYAIERHLIEIGKYEWIVNTQQEQQEGRRSSRNIMDLFKSH